MKTKSFVIVFIFLISIKNVSIAQFTEAAISIPDLWNSSVAWGDYNNDGYIDLLVTGQTTNNQRISRLYQNNQCGFTQTASFDGVEYSSAVWGDYDSDGFLDIILSGYTSTNIRITKVYHNNSNGSFSLNSSISLPGITGSSLNWVDFDNDGDLDVFLSGGVDTYSNISKIYRNDNTNFVEHPASFIGLRSGSSSWGDFDNDGDADLLYTGLNDADSALTKIYTNNGDGTFVQSNINLIGTATGDALFIDFDKDKDLDIFLIGGNGNNASFASANIYKNDSSDFTLLSVLTPVFNGATASADFNNDGLFDILLTGINYGNYCTKIFQNNGVGIFNDINFNSIIKVAAGSVAWGDFDNDGDMDFIMSGMNENNVRTTRIYQNDGGTNLCAKNTAPSAPANLNSLVDENNVMLYWDKATDVETEQDALTYNLYIGTSPNQVDVVSPMSDLYSGKRKVAQIGNTNSNISWDINGLPPGIYYWSVQSIDNAFEGSAFATEQTFEILTSVNSFNYDPGIKIFPVPGKTNIYVHSDININAEIRIMTTDLQTILIDKITNNFKEINISGYPTGIYLVKISSNDFVAVKKIIIQ